jgi:hypothetical protein
MSSFKTVGDHFLICPDGTHFKTECCEDEPDCFYIANICNGPNCDESFGLLQVAVQCSHFAAYCRDHPGECDNGLVFSAVGVSSGTTGVPCFSLPANPDPVESFDPLTIFGPVTIDPRFQFDECGDCCDCPPPCIPLQRGEEFPGDCLLGCKFPPTPCTEAVLETCPSTFAVTIPASVVGDSQGGCGPSGQLSIPTFSTSVVYQGGNSWDSDFVLVQTLSGPDLWAQVFLVCGVNQWSVGVGFCLSSQSPALTGENCDNWQYGFKSIILQSTCPITGSYLFTTFVPNAGDGQGSVLCSPPGAATVS